MDTIKRDLLYIPLMVGTFSRTFDFCSSWFLINYLDAGIGEFNPLVSDNNHQIDMVKGITILVAYIVGLLVFSCFIYYKAKRPSSRQYEAFYPFFLVTKLSKTKEIPEETFGSYGSNVIALFTYVSVAFLIPFVLNPLVLIFDIPVLFTSLQLFLLIAFIGTCVAACWYSCFAYRYLTPEARQRYRWLQWPYKIGFMKDVI